VTRAVYELVGRLMVRLWRVRYRRQLRAAAAVGVAAILAAGYVVITREPPEG
jgi:peptidoglycan/LPS O-acetylase OafA/YrhL